MTYILIILFQLGTLPAAVTHPPEVHYYGKAIPQAGAHLKALRAYNRAYDRITPKYKGKTDSASVAQWNAELKPYQDACDK